MLRFKPCPLFVFLSLILQLRCKVNAEPSSLELCWAEARNRIAIHRNCNFVAKVRIISETTKLFSNFFAIFCKNILLASAEANFSLFTLHFSLFLSCHFSVSEIPPRRAPAVISTRQSCHLSPWYLVAVLSAPLCRYLPTYPVTHLWQEHSWSLSWKSWL